MKAAIKAMSDTPIRTELPSAWLGTHRKEFTIMATSPLCQQEGFAIA